MTEEVLKKKYLWRVWEKRNLICFWILGLANNYGYVVMLSAAHDILKDFDIEDKVEKTEYKRNCNTLSTGIILLADIVPTLFIKLIAPFVPFCVFVRMSITIATSILGFLLVAFRINKSTVIIGVCCMAISAGLGEVTLLAYMVFFKTKNILSTWSSGTGGAGIFGSTSYAALIAIGLSPFAALLIMLIVPVIQAISFYLTIEHPIIDKGVEEEDIPTHTDVITFREKIKTLPRLLGIYMIPFGLTFFFQYTINQGLFELLYFPHAFMDKDQQYRWYSVLYQVGVFISRSSMNIVEIDYLWTLAFIEGFNLAFCLTEVFVGYVTFLPIMMLFIFWEGLIGGASYVNTYRRIISETPINYRQFYMAFNTVGGTAMITVAGSVSQPLHNHICKNYDPQYPLKK